jgi:hypothetical protein
MTGRPHNSAAVKPLFFVGVLLLLPVTATAHNIPIIDGHLSGGNGFVMWSSVDTNIDSRRVEPSFSMHFDDAQILHGKGPRFELARDALHFLGTPFVWGGSTPSGFDCSGFVQHVFAELGKQLPRTADYQFAALPHLKRPLETGDLVFFQTYAPGASHVGIYLGNGRFVHSARPFVHISSLTDPYYAARYLGAASAF